MPKLVMTTWDAGCYPCFFEDDPPKVYVGDVSWADARARMVETFTRWLSDDCECCAGDAAEHLPGLLNLPSDTGWEGDVDGNDYFIAWHVFTRQCERCETVYAPRQEPDRLCDVCVNATGGMTRLRVAGDAQ